MNSEHSITVYFLSPHFHLPLPSPCKKGKTWEPGIFLDQEHNPQIPNSNDRGAEREATFNKET